MENHNNQPHMEKRKALYVFILTTTLASILWLIEFWYLIILPGMIAGILIKTRKSMKIGALGMSLSWGIYILIAFFTRNTYMYLDQFAGLIFGSLGYGWILLIAILIIGAFFGALGAALGALSAIIISSRLQIKSSVVESKI